VVAACRRPGVSIAAVALEYRLNANLVRRWVVTEERSDEYGSLERYESADRVE
jgi:transposase-like protein